MLLYFLQEHLCLRGEQVGTPFLSGGCAGPCRKSSSRSSGPRRLLASGEARSISAATRSVDLSRSAFYKYKDCIFDSEERPRGHHRHGDPAGRDGCIAEPSGRHQCRRCQHRDHQSVYSGERSRAGGCHHPHRHHADDPRGADGKAFAPADGRGRTLRIQSVTVHS